MKSFPVKRKSLAEVKVDGGWLPGIVLAARGNDLVIECSQERIRLKVSDKGDTWRLIDASDLGN